MSNRVYLLGIDIGTTGTKCSVYNTAGEITSSSYREYPMIHPHDNWTEQNPLVWWDAVKLNLNAIFTESNIDSHDIKAISISCTNAVVVVDAQGQPLYNAISHQDRRSAGQVEWLKEHMDENEVISVSGNRIAMGSFFLPSIRWLIDNHKINLSESHKILMPSGFIIHRLTGVFSINKPRASFSLLYNLKSNCWDEKLANDAEIPITLLPDVYYPTDIVGFVSEAASKQTGLAPGTPVTGGCLDTVAATLATGAVDIGDISLTVGSSARICCISNHPAKDCRLLTACSPYENLYTIVQSTDNAGVSLRWFRDTFGKSIEADAQAEGVSIYNHMDKLASSITVSSESMIYLPYLNGEKSPIWDPNAKGVFFGVTLDTTYAHFIKSIMEGVAYSIRDCLEQMNLEISPGKIIPIGGGSSNSSLWCQIFADVLNHPITQVKSAETETLGDFILAAQSIGLTGISRHYGKDSLSEGKTFKPILANVTIYNELFYKYKLLYSRIKDLFFSYESSTSHQ